MGLRGRRTILGALLAILAIAVAVTLWMTRSRTEGGPQPGQTLGYAYTTATDLIIQPGTGGPIRLPGRYDGGALFYTATGTFLVTAALDATDKANLMVVNTVTGAVRRIACNCWSAAPVGSDRIAYVDRKSRKALTFDLFSGAAAEPLPADLPGDRQVTEVMAGAAGTVLVRGQTTPPGSNTPDYGSPDVLYALKVGDPKPREVVRHPAIAGSTATAGVGPDGVARFGVTISDDELHCGSNTYWLYDASTGRATHPPPFVPSASAEQSRMTVTDWWWDDRGSLTASLSSHRCPDEQMTSSPTLWRLDGERWTPLSRTNADAVRPLGAGTTLLLRRAGEARLSVLLRTDGANEKPVADQVRDLTVAPARPEPRPSGIPAAPPIDPEVLWQAGVCRVACKVTGRVAFEHPTWGPVTLVTTLARNYNSRDGNLAVLDAYGAVKWRHHGSDLFLLKPLKPARDSTGHIFLTYNPGKYDGLIVLKPDADTFRDFGSLPPVDGYGARFEYADAKDTDGDGSYEIEKFHNDCEPSCADGRTTRTVLRWNGRDYG